MEMPKPGPGHEKLKMFVGDWEAEETLHPSPMDENGGTATGRVQNRSALDGFVVIQDYEQERHGEIVFRGHGVFTWNMEENCCDLYWFDSMGMAPDVFKGEFEGEKIVFRTQSPMGHFRVTFDFSAGDHYDYLMEVSGDGENWGPFMEGKYVKQ